MKRREIVRELRRLVRSRGNDAVRLACMDGEALPDIGALDLAGVTELKRSEKGCFEVKFVDKVKVLTLLAQLSDQEGADGAEAFLRELQRDDEV